MSAVLSKLIKKCLIKVLEVDENKRIVLARFRFYKDNGRLTFKKEISFKIKTIMCMQCYHRHSGYYEAVIQLRSDSEIIQENKMKKVDNMMNHIVDFTNHIGGFVARLDKKRGGYDIYVSDKNEMSRFFQVRKLKPKISYVLYGLKNGKKVYRNIYLLKI